MDTTIILVPVLSALFLGSLLWLVFHSRRRRGAAVPARREGTPAGKTVRGRAAGRGKTR